MSDQADEVIDKLKKRFRVTTDQELARKLGLGRSAIGSWRSRNSVPARYVEAAEGSNWSAFNHPWSEWSDLERQAFEVAVFRLIHEYKDITESYRNYLMRGGEAAAMLWDFHASAIDEITDAAHHDDGSGWNKNGDLIIYERYFEGT